MMTALSTPELPSWALSIPFVLIGFPVLSWLVRNRSRSVPGEMERLARVASLPDPGADAHTVRERLASRYAGRVIGVAAVGLLALAAISITSVRGDFPVWIVVYLPVGHAIGTALGNLIGVSVPTASPRVTTLRRRELTDYVTPIEVRVAQLAGFLSVAAVVMGLIALTTTTSSTSSGVVVAAAGFLSLLAAAGTWTLAGRTLVQPVDATAPAGLLWNGVLRAAVLRDLVNAVTMFGAWGGGGALLWGIAQGWASYPDWFLVVGGLVLVAVVVCTAVVLVLSVVDRHFDRVRHHALAEVAR
jgi:hypothetical protein